MSRSRTILAEDFAGVDLDPEVWCTSYLPHWSSRAASAATYEIRDGELHLSIPAEQGLWCPDLHADPLRVSCIQSGNRSGPVGSTDGPQPFVPEIVVREEQPTMWGYTPMYGRIEIRMRGLITPRSMFAFWLSGIEDQPERCGEICVAEIFGDAVRDGSADVGIGLHEFRDPALHEDFSAEPFELDVAEFHTYAVDWRPGSLAFSIDGDAVRQVDQAPDYPVQLMVGVFDFPDKVTDADSDAVPRMVVSHIKGETWG
jgi:hypothetical protein